VADEEGGAAKRVAWVGPQESALAAAFANRGRSACAYLVVITR
jgi:hypothetical protein